MPYYYCTPHAIRPPLILLASRIQESALSTELDTESWIVQSLGFPMPYLYRSRARACQAYLTRPACRRLPSAHLASQRPPAGQVGSKAAGVTNGSGVYRGASPPPSRSRGG